MNLNINKFIQEIEAYDFKACMADGIDLDNQNIVAVLILSHNLLVHEEDFSYISIRSRSEDGCLQRLLSHLSGTFLGEEGQSLYNVDFNSDMENIPIKDSLIIYDPKRLLKEDENLDPFEIFETAFIRAYEQLEIPCFSTAFNTLSNSGMQAIPDKTDTNTKKLFYF